MPTANRRKPTNLPKHRPPHPLESLLDVPQDIGQLERERELRREAIGRFVRELVGDVDDRPDLDNKVVAVAVAKGRDPREALGEFDVQLASLERFRSNPADALWVNVACQLAKGALEDAQQIYLGSFDSGSGMLAVHDVQNRFISITAKVCEGLTILNRCEKTIPRPLSHAVMFCGRSDSTAIRRALRWADDFSGMVGLCFQGHRGKDAKQAYYSGAYNPDPEFPISARWATEVSTGKETSDARDVIRLVARCSKTALKEITKLPFPDEEGPDGFDSLKAKMDSEVASAQQRQGEDKELPRNKTRTKKEGRRVAASHAKIKAEEDTPGYPAPRIADIFLYEDAGEWKCFGTPIRWQKPSDKKCFDMLISCPGKWTTRQMHKKTGLRDSTIESSMSRIRSAFFDGLKHRSSYKDKQEDEVRSTIRDGVLMQKGTGPETVYRLNVEPHPEGGFRVPQAPATVGNRTAVKPESGKKRS